MLHCDFPLGRPLGRPNEPAFQHRVLAAALGLVQRVDVPVLVDFDVVIEDEADTPLSCSLPPRHNPALHPAVDEALGLRPAYDRRFAETGKTNVGRLGGPERVPELVALFVRVVEGAAWDSFDLTPAQIGQAALDIRAFFEEAAVALAGHVPAARQAESWFYRSTATGLVLRQAQAALRSADAPRPCWFPVVPNGQPPA